MAWQEATGHFFALSVDMLWTTTLSGRIQQINPAVTRILGYTGDALRDTSVLDLIHREERQFAESRIAELARGNPIEGLETRFQCAGGAYKWIGWTSTPYLAEELAYTVARDRTLRMQYEQDLRQSDERCICALESTTDAFFAIDQNWRLIRINQQTERLWKRTRDQVLGRSLWELFPQDAGSRFHRAYEEVLRTGTPTHFEERYPHSRREKWFEVHAYPNVEGLAVYFRDVTDRHQADDRMKRSLAEREVLLREVHHRVKNNLQVICSMLRLQSRQIHDETMQQVLRDCRERVLAMAMLHDQLHRAKDFSNINLGDYIRNLAASLFCSYGVNSAVIGVEMDVEDVVVPIDTAIPCGLIVNEIISNSLRHAFSEGSKGCVRVGLHAASAGRVELTISDNGRGLGDRAEPHHGRSLGLRLIDLLAEQIDAAVERSSNGGTQYRLLFQTTYSKETEPDE